MQVGETFSREREIRASVRLRVDLKCYGRDVIYRTAYAFTDRAFIWLEPGDGEEIVVALTPKTTDDDADQLGGEFGNALIDFALRQQVGVETRIIREAIFATAFQGARIDG